MVKHRRWSDKPKSDFPEKENKVELTSENTSIPKSPNDAKSIILSGTKYAYIIVAVALFSGIFTPLTLGIEIEEVIAGMFTIFLGLGGGIMIFLGIKYQKYTTLLICSGLGIMIASLLLIFEQAGRSLFT
tara:strand:- start:63 stop:452 length:390 start_codon:yes stop_codon:yes gene_type:complete